MLNDEFPESLLLFRARLRGLLGDALSRDKGRVGVEVFADFADRSESRPLGRRGVKLGDWDVLVGCEKTAVGGAVCACAEGDARRCGVRPKRRHGDWGDGCCDVLPSELFELERDRNFVEGDLDMDRRKVLTAEVTSIWCAWVGDGKARVPPSLPWVKDMVFSLECNIWQRGDRRSRAGEECARAVGAVYNTTKLAAAGVAGGCRLRLTRPAC